MKRFLRIIVYSLSSAVLLSILTVAGVAAYVWNVWSSNALVIDSLISYRPPIITEVFSDDHTVIGRFWEEKRVVVPLAQLPDHLVLAFVAAEDARFFEHKGVDFLSIARAFLRNLVAGRVEQGGSTITQQITRSLLLKNKERSYRRKAREAMLSIQLEKGLSKEQILHLYLNSIYLGEGAYGVEAAARTYFGKSAKDLTLAESALLAGLTQAPARYSPVSHFERARTRQRYALDQMFWSGFISGEQLGKALAEKVRIRKKEEKTFSRAPYFTEHVRRYLIQTYGRARVYRQGLTVYTTVNLRMQEAARKALQKGLYELDKREGYRGPLRRLPPGQIPGFIEAAAKRQALHEPAMGSIVEGVVIRVDDKKGEAAVCIGSRMGRLPLSRMRWARRPNAQVSYPGNRVRRPSQVLSKGDVIQLRLIKGARTPFAWEVSLEQTPLVQGALFCMDPGTGEVKAMVGGRDYDQSQFNRAVQSRRQPGSAFKPIIYAAALDSGMTPGTVLLDAPFVCEQGPHMKPWKPENYTKEYLGPIILRNALAKSKNVVTVKLLKRIGVPHAVRYARNLGIQSPLSPYLALALGCSGVSLMELTRAYSVFCNQGVLVRPIFIKRIVDRDGRVLEENRPVTRRAISKETAYLITDLLRTVIREGTGRRVRAFKRPAAGKTGTTNNLWDAWFVGYTPDLATGVWVGYDDRRPMGKRETGSKAASPIWLAFMSSVFKGLPVTDFQVPKGMVYAKIDTKTGLLADSDTEASVIQVFKKGSEPKFTSAEADEDTLLSSRFLQFDLGNSQ